MSEPKAKNMRNFFHEFRLKSHQNIVTKIFLIFYRKFELFNFYHTIYVEILRKRRRGKKGAFAHNQYQKIYLPDLNNTRIE